MFAKSIDTHRQEKRFAPVRIERGKILLREIEKPAKERSLPTGDSWTATFISGSV